MTGTLAALATIASTLVAPVSAQAAGTAVLSVSIKPVDYQSGADQTTAQAGTHGDKVAYLIGYSCTSAGCGGANVTISAPQPDPNGLAAQVKPLPNGMVAPPTLLAYQSWTPPFSGATIATEADGSEQVSLGDLSAGATGTFLVIYEITSVNDLLHSSPHVTYTTPSPAQFYPDGFQIQMSATMVSDTATGPATTTAAPVTWHNAVPAPSVRESNPGTGTPASVAPDTQVTYTIAMGSGAFTSPSGGNIVGDSSLVAAGSYTVVDQLPPQATFVSSSPDGTYDAASRTITWTNGTAASPSYTAAGGWGSASGANWNHLGNYTTRTVTVSYPASAFPDADENGCNFSDAVTNSVTATVTYLDPAQTTKSVSTSQSDNVECYTPFAQAELSKTVDHDSVSGGTDVVAVPPDTAGMTCPASGRDDWGRTCTPGAAVASFTKDGAWYVEADNEGNRDGVATITDNDLGLDGAHVTTIARDSGNAAIASIAWTLNDGTTGVSTGGGSITAPAGKWYTAATVTSAPISPAVTSQTEQSVTNPIKQKFIVEFFYYVNSSAPVGTTITNHATASMSYRDTGLTDITDLSATRAVEFAPLRFAPVFTASQPSAPVVSGGGNPVPGTPVTFTLTGRAQTVNSDGSTVGGLPDGTDITPEYVFLAPANWAIQPGSASFPEGSVPTGVNFNYTAVALDGQQHQAVVATWPNTVTFGDDGTPWPTMSVIATPAADAGNTTGTATLYIGDSRDSFDNTTGEYTNAVQNTADVNGDGNTRQWFASTTSSGVFVSGAAGLTVVKQICEPDTDASDGCDWISNPGSVVGVATDATDIRYRVTLTNTGSAPITNAVAYDVLPYVGDTGTSQSTAGTSRGSTFDETLTSVSDESAAISLAYSASSNPCRPQVYPSAPGCTDDWGGTAAGASAIRATIASLVAGASASFSYDAAVAVGATADALGCNSVAVASDQTITAEPEAVCASTEQADLAVSAPDRYPMQTGRPAQLNFQVVNHGGSQFSPATVQLQVPAGLTVTSLTPTGYTCTDASGDPAPIIAPVALTCAATNPDGSTRGLTRDIAEMLSLPVTVTATDPGPVCLSGTVSGPLPDPDAGNNSATDVCWVVAPAVDGISLSKDDGTASVAVGSQTTYTITVSNPLVAEAITGAVLTDTLPTGEQFVSATGGGIASGPTVTWDLADLAPAGSVTSDGSGTSGGDGSTAAIELTVDITGSAVGPLANTVAVTAPDPADPSATLVGEASDTDTVTNVFSDGDPRIVTPQNRPITTPLGDIMTAAGAPMDPTSVVQEAAPTHGTIAIDPITGAVTYSPSPGYTGTDSYTVRACDSSTPAPQCHATVVAVTVLPNAVVAHDEAISTRVDTPSAPIDVLSSATSASGQPLRAPTVTTNPTHGDVIVNPDGTLTYTPDGSYQGDDSFTYTVCDSGAPRQACDTATIKVTVTPVADPGVTKTPSQLTVTPPSAAPGTPAAPYNLLGTTSGPSDPSATATDPPDPSTTSGLSRGAAGGLAAAGADPVGLAALAQTGIDPVGQIGLAGALLLGGAAVLCVGRRRRRH